MLKSPAARIRPSVRMAPSPPPHPPVIRPPFPRRHWAVVLAQTPIHAYRYAISPMLPPRCRFWPSCSAYALQALQEHGLWRGGWLAARRLCRCHPWDPGGVDPVPLAVPEAGMTGFLPESVPASVTGAAPVSPKAHPPHRSD